MDPKGRAPSFQEHEESLCQSVSMYGNLPYKSAGWHEASLRLFEEGAGLPRLQKYYILLSNSQGRKRLARNARALTAHKRRRASKSRFSRNTSSLIIIKYYTSFKEKNFYLCRKKLHQSILLSVVLFSYHSLFLLPFHFSLYFISCFTIQPRWFPPFPFHNPLYRGRHT